MTVQEEPALAAEKPPVTRGRGRAFLIFFVVLGVIAIGGCTSYRQISPLFRAVLAGGAAVPPGFLRTMLRLGPIAFTLFERLDREQGALMTELVAALGSVAAVLGRDLADADWWRLIDAVLLVAACPAEPG